MNAVGLHRCASASPPRAGIKARYVPRSAAVCSQGHALWYLYASVSRIQADSFCLIRGNRSQLRWYSLCKYRLRRCSDNIWDFQNTVKVNSAYLRGRRSPTALSRVVARILYFSTPGIFCSRSDWDAALVRQRGRPGVFLLLHIFTFSVKRVVAHARRRVEAELWAS